MPDKRRPSFPRLPPKILAIVTVLIVVALAIWKTAAVFMIGTDPEAIEDFVALKGSVPVEIQNISLHRANLTLNIPNSAATGYMLDLGTGTQVRQTNFSLDALAKRFVHVEYTSCGANNPSDEDDLVIEMTSVDGSQSAKKSVHLKQALATPVSAGSSVLSIELSARPIPENNPVCIAYINPFPLTDASLAGETVTDINWVMNDSEQHLGLLLSTYVAGATNQNGVVEPFGCYNWTSCTKSCTTPFNAGTVVTSTALADASIAGTRPVGIIALSTKTDSFPASICVRLSLK